MSPRPQLNLDVDLLIEQGGHRFKLTGSETRLVARFPTLRSLFHYSRFFWPAMDRMPKSLSLVVEWWRFRVEVRSPREWQERAR